MNTKIEQSVKQSVINLWSKIIKSHTHFTDNEDIEKMCMFAHYFSLNFPIYNNSKLNTGDDDKFLILNIKVLNKFDSLDKIEIMAGPVCEYEYNKKSMFIQTQTIATSITLNEVTSTLSEVREDDIIEKIVNNIKKYINEGKTVFIYMPISKISLKEYSAICESRFAAIDLNAKTKNPNKTFNNEYCLCRSNCVLFKPNTSENCEILQKLCQFDIDNDVTTTICECKKYNTTN